MIKKILVIINPISGYSRSRGFPLSLQGRLEREGFYPTIYFTNAVGDGRFYARKYGADYDLVIIAGGDGTISEVIDGLAGLSVPVTLFPAGTENLFAKEMEIPADLDQLVETIKWGKVTHIDIPQVNGRRFLMVSGVGFDAEVLLHLNTFRTGNITHLTYFWPIWRTFWEYRFNPVTVEADGKLLVENQRGLVFVANISRYSVGLRIGKLAKYDDGLLDVCIYLCDDQKKLLGHAWRTVRKKHLENPNVIYQQAKMIKVTSSISMPFETDGDPAGNLPAEYSMTQDTVKVLVPPG